MKKLLAIACLASFAFTPAAFAGHHEDGEKGGKMFEKHDTNGDGEVSKDEYLAHAAEKFATQDTNGDGVISADEAKAHHKAKKDAKKEMKAEKKEHQDYD